MGLGNKEGRVLTVGMGTQTLCGILRDLPKKWITYGAIKEDVKSIVVFVGEFANTRNYIAHGIWTKFENDPLPYLNLMKQGDHRLLPKGQAISPGELRLFSEHIQAMAHLACDIANKLDAGGVPLPDTHGEQNPAGLPTQTQTPKLRAPTTNLWRH